MIDQYPGFIQERIRASRRGPSRAARTHILNCHSLKWLRRVHRVCVDKVKNYNDFHFAEFCRSQLGFSPEDKWVRYGVSTPNKEAGYKSVVKYDKVQPFLDMELWNRTMTWAQLHFVEMSGSVLLREFEAIKSVINLLASSGYPFGLEFQKKKNFFNWVKAREYLDAYWDDIGHRHRWCVWANNVKEEIRTIAKIWDNNLRTFLGSSVEHVYACTKLFGDMNNRFYESAGRTWSYVGSSKFRFGWDTLFKRLNKHPNAFELDETEFDSSLFREAMYGMAEFRKRMLSPRENTRANRNRIDSLYRNIVDSIIVTQDGDLVQKNTGNPSGSSNTVVDNTVVLFRLFCYAWLVLTRDKPELATYDMFLKHVEAALNGDDNTWTCSDEVVGWFNAETVAYVWSSVGVTTKWRDSPTSRKLIDCKFLSTWWRDLGGVYVPVPEREKVMSSMAFHSRSPKDARWSLLRACALRIECFWDVEARKLLADFIRWLIKTKWDELHKPNDKSDPRDMFTYETVYSVYKTDQELEQLYLGAEGGQFTPRSLDDILQNLPSVACEAA